MKTALFTLSLLMTSTAFGAEIPLKHGDALEVRVVGCPHGTLPYIDVVGPNKNDRGHKVLTVECATTICRFDLQQFTTSSDDKITSAYGKVWLDYQLKDHTTHIEELEMIGSEQAGEFILSSSAEIANRAQYLINSGACGKIEGLDHLSK